MVSLSNQAAMNVYESVPFDKLRVSGIEPIVSYGDLGN